MYVGPDEIGFRSQSCMGKISVGPIGYIVRAEIFVTCPKRGFAQIERWAEVRTRHAASMLANAWMAAPAMNYASCMAENAKAAKKDLADPLEAARRLIKTRDRAMPSKLPALEIARRGAEKAAQAHLDLS